MQRVVLLILVGACFSGEPTARPPTGTPSDAKALDYAAPFDRTARTERHLQALRAELASCRANDADACWRAAVLHRNDFARAEGDPRELLQEAVLAVAEHCLVGHDRSCSVLGSSRSIRDALLGPHAADLCHRGVAAACLALADDQVMIASRRAAEADRPGIVTLLPEELEAQQVWYTQGCALGDPASCGNLPEADRAKISALAKAECQRGWVESCWLVHGSDAIVLETALRSCTAGVLSDCARAYATENVPAASRIIALERVCPTLGEGCSALGAERLAGRDLVAARDAFEQGCQIGDDYTCLELARHYLDGTLTEPVAGRGRRLARFLCALPETRWDAVMWNGMPYSRVIEHASVEACQLAGAIRAP